MNLYEYVRQNNRVDLLLEWDREANKGLDPARLSTDGRNKVAWVCGRGHHWNASLKSRVSAQSGCPYCAGSLPIPGETDLATEFPDLAAEWDREKNGEGPETASRGSIRPVWWRCALGHSFQQRVYARVAGDGCPYCAGKKVLPGFNDLATTDPELLLDWDEEKNELSPDQVNRGSHKKVWWRCALGHSYETAVYTHAAGSDCPYCTGRRVLPGFNDLATTHPRVAAQWEPRLNGELTPQQVTRGSNKKVWWQCAEGHVWQAAVFSRTRKRASDCPVCAGTAKRRPRRAWSPEAIKPPLRMPERVAV